MTDRPGDTEYNAARIALLAIRAGLGQADHPAPRSFLWPTFDTPVDREAAAVLLAGTPKPIACKPAIIADVISIGPRPLQDAERRSHSDCVSYWESRGGLLGGPYEGSVTPDDQIMCVGYDEIFLCHPSDYDTFVAGYDGVLAGMVGSPPSWFLPIARDVALQAHKRGVKIILRFGERPDEWVAERAGQMIVLRYPNYWDYPEVLAHLPQEIGLCNVCSSRGADWRATDTRKPAWPEEHLCSVCAADWLTSRERALVTSFQDAIAAASPAGLDELRTGAGYLFRDLRRRWKRLVMPPEVAEIAAWYQNFARRGAA